MNTTPAPAWAGFLKMLAGALIIWLLSWLGTASNLTDILNPATATIVAGIFAAIDSYFESNSGRALFGTIKTRYGNQSSVV